jgi:outer membrane protein OmpA-like peptidoglycan-associated protein
MVEGHTDPRGTADSNLVLSRERADSVRRYLIENHGIEADRLTAEGKGDREPLNTSSPAAPENRRVTFVTLGNR